MIDYIKRHWRGELSLPQSYWVNGVIVGWPISMYMTAVAIAFKAHPPQTLPPFLYWIVLPWLAFQPLAIWQGVGIWRSAGGRIAEGRKGWAWVARAVILLNAAFLIFNGIVNYDIVNGYFLDRDAKFAVAKSGFYVTFTGTITDRSAEKLEPLLRASDTTQLVINGSYGGLMLPALRIAKIIHDKRMSVIATRYCDSACTVLLAAGKIRGIGPFATVGLHHSTISGLRLPTPEWTESERYYLSHGMSKQLLAKINARGGPNDVYEPTLRELIENGLVNAIVNPVTHRYSYAVKWCQAHQFMCNNTGRQNAALYGVKTTP